MARRKHLEAGMIETHKLSPTNYRGTRIVGRMAHGKRVVMAYDYALSAFENHRVAAERAAEGNAVVKVSETTRGYRWRVA